MFVRRCVHHLGSALEGGRWPYDRNTVIASNTIVPNTIQHHPTLSGTVVQCKESFKMANEHLPEPFFFYPSLPQFLATNFLLQLPTTKLFHVPSPYSFTMFPHHAHHTLLALTQPVRHSSEFDQITLAMHIPKFK